MLLAFKYFDIESRRNAWRVLHEFLIEHEYDTMYSGTNMFNEYDSSHKDSFLPVLTAGHDLKAGAPCIVTYERYLSSTHAIHVTEHHQFSPHVLNQRGMNLNTVTGVPYWSTERIVQDGHHSEYSLIVDIENDGVVMLLKLVMP